MMNSGSLDARSPYSSALLTDLYELTMACAFWKSGIAGRELRRVGRELWGIRLDSGDLAYLL
jgi:nicotinic acid phosphoribosyltransferase